MNAVGRRRRTKRLDVGPWSRAVNEPDADNEFVDPEVTVQTPADPYRVEGIADDREEFEMALGTARSRVVVTFFARGAFGSPGTEAPVHWKITEVLVRRPGGWKIVHIHVSGAS